jgi:molybdopterin molybdotransferase
MRGNHDWSPFPRVVSTDPLDVLDCCVKVEDTRPLSTSTPKDGAESSHRLIQILKPARSNQNKRLAGEDFQRRDMIVDQHVVVQSNHVMALASVGYGSVEVLKRPRIALFSTGAEIVSHAVQDGTSGRQQVSDVNGPYIMSVLQEAFACEVDFLGILEDNPTTAADTISDHIKREQYDVVITTGAVSMGRYDFIPKALEMLDASIVFHKVAMKPGHPALYAKISSMTRKESSKVPFFGLPGNPVAAAACLRFLVFPFLRFLLFQDLEKPRQAVIRSVKSNEQQVTSKMHDSERNVIGKFPSDRDVFRAGTIIHQTRNSLEVQMIQDHSPGKISPFLVADCWIHIPREKTILHNGDVVDVFLI